MSDVIILGGFNNHKRGKTYQTGYIIYDKDFLSPTLLADGGGYGVLIIETSETFKKGKK